MPVFTAYFFPDCPHFKKPEAFLSASYFLNAGGRILGPMCGKPDRAPVHEPLCWGGGQCMLTMLGEVEKDRVLPPREHSLWPKISLQNTAYAKP